jgi:hypothetical protein
VLGQFFRGSRPMFPTLGIAGAGRPGLELPSTFQAMGVSDDLGPLSTFLCLIVFDVVGSLAPFGPTPPSWDEKNGEVLGESNSMLPKLDDGREGRSELLLLVLSVDLWSGREPSAFSAGGGTIRRMDSDVSETKACWLEDWLFLSEDDSSLSEDDWLVSTVWSFPPKSISFAVEGALAYAGRLPSTSLPPCFSDD